MLGHRRRRWSNIEPALAQRPLHAYRAVSKFLFWGRRRWFDYYIFKISESEIKLTSLTVKGSLL